MIAHYVNFITWRSKALFLSHWLCKYKTISWSPPPSPRPLKVHFSRFLKSHLSMLRQVSSDRCHFKISIQQSLFNSWGWGVTKINAMKIAQGITSNVAEETHRTGLIYNSIPIPWWFRLWISECCCLHLWTRKEYIRWSSLSQLYCVWWDLLGII